MKDYRDIGKVVEGAINPRNAGPFEKAEQELQHAQACLKALPDSSDRAVYEKVWSDFVIHLSSAYTSAWACGKEQSPKFAPWMAKGWDKRKKASPLLIYLDRARDIAIHGNLHVDWEGGSISLLSSEGGGVSFYRNIRGYKNGQIDAEFESPVEGARPNIQIDPGKPKLPTLEHSNAGQVPPPDNDSGKPITSTDPVVIGEQGLRFYQGMLAEIVATWTK